MWRTREASSTPGGRMILGLETSCDDTCAAVIDRRRPDPVERDLLAGDPRTLRRSRPRDRVAPPPRADRRGRRRRARPRRRLARRGRAGRRDPGPGLVAALLVGVATAKALAAALARRWRRSTISTDTSLRASSARRAVRPPFLSLIASGGHTLLARVRSRPRLRGDRADARRRGRGGVRQGRAAARARVSGRPRARAAGPRGRPEAFAFPTAQDGRARLLVRGAEDRAAVPGPRPRGGGGRAPPRGPRRLISARDRRVAGAARRARPGRDGLERLASAAGSPRTARCANGCPSSASRSTFRRSSCAPTTPR